MQTREKSQLSKTQGCPWGFWALFPTSGNLSPPIPWELDSPKQNSNPSRIWDFPEPFRPEMTVKPGSRGTEVVPPQDLKLGSSTGLTCTIDAAYLV